MRDFNFEETGSSAVGVSEGGVRVGCRGQLVGCPPTLCASQAASENLMRSVKLPARPRNAQAVVAEGVGGPSLWLSKLAGRWPFWVPPVGIQLHGLRAVVSCFRPSPPLVSPACLTSTDS